MWVNTWRPHLEGVSLWRYALNFLVVIIAALLWAILVSPATHAAEASWNASNGSIRYANLDFQGPQTADGTTPPGVPSGAVYYQNLNGSGGSSKASIIYFEKDADLKNVTSAKYAQYDYDQGATQKYSNPTNQRGISIDKQPADAADKKEQTSCVVGGIGFIVCPVMKFLAEAMDKVYDVLKTFLTVQPLSTDREGGLYKAWALMLSIANILFVIGFLVIIYAYITNQGVKQYDIRTIIPRLIVAAVLINASYYICAIAVDLSNVFGANLQDMFNGIRTSLVGNKVSDASAWTSWQSITIFLLSGGTMGVAGLVALGVYGGAALHLLMPMLVTAIISVLVAVVVLAARQAIITVLIVIAPIAFAAFILPSTQKYFEKWRGLFMTMLLVYPMFSVLFGGSQLAATLIAQNATNVTTIMLAMFVQVVPLMITPFLVRFSGSLLGKVAGMVNDPAKGLGDRAKNWSTGRLDHAKNRRLQEENKGWKRTPGLALAKNLDSKKRKRASQLERYKSARNAQYAMESGAGEEHVATRRAKAAEEAATWKNDAKFEAEKFTNSDLKRESANHKVAENQLHNNKAHWENYLAEIESEKGRLHHAGQGDTTASAVGAALHAQGLDHAAQERRKEMAAQEHRSEIADAMMQDAALKAAASGISGQKGEAIVMAQAVVDKRADFGKGVSAIKEMEKHFRLSGSEVESIAMRTGGPITKTDSNGNSYTFDYNNDHAFEAAVDTLINEKGSYAQKMALLEKSADPEYAEVRTTLVEGVKKSMLSAAPQLGGQSLDVIGTTGVAGPGGADKLTRNYVMKAKMSQEALANMDADNAKVFIRAITDPVNFDGIDRSKRLEYQANRAELIKTARAALDNPRLDGVIKKNLRTQLEALSNLPEY